MCCAQLNYKYDVQAEADVVGWLNALLSERIPAGKQNVHKALRTGELLAKCATAPCLDALGGRLRVECTSRGVLEASTRCAQTHQRDLPEHADAASERAAGAAAHPLPREQPALQTGTVRTLTLWQTVKVSYNAPLLTRADGEHPDVPELRRGACALLCFVLRSLWLRFD